MQLRWDDLHLFSDRVRTRQPPAPPRASKQLGQPTLSRRIGELEQSGGRAAVRAPSQHAPDRRRAKLLPAAQRMADGPAAAVSIDGDASATGKVRIAAPPLVAYEVLAPLAARFGASYPAIRIEILAGVETLNLSRGEADLSLRIAHPAIASC